MAYTVRLLVGVEKFLSKLQPKARHQIYSKIDSLAEDPRPRNMKRLKGVPETFRVRSGDYRILYKVKDDELLVLVIRVGHRKNVYQNLPGATD